MDSYLQRIKLWLNNEKEITPFLNGQNIWIPPPMKKDMQMNNKHMKRWSTSLVIREMQIKTKIRHHFILPGVVITKETERKNNKYWWGCGGIEHVHCKWGCKIVQTLWKSIWKFLKKLSVELPCGSVTPLLSVYPREMKTCTYRTPTWMVKQHCS